MEHRWVMHVWSNGAVSAWHTRNDALFERLYGKCEAPQPQRECTPEELAEILEEQKRFGRGQ